MRKLIKILFVLVLFVSCSTNNHESEKTEQAQAALKEQASIKKSNALNGKAFNGSVKARGIIGLFSVNGRLSFEDGFLVWSAKNTKDSGSYETIEVDGGISFQAHVTIENNEHVLWTGFYDGQTLHNVQAIWTRNKGDFFHDLLLPDQVTLDFTLK